MTDKNARWRERNRDSERQRAAGHRAGLKAAGLPTTRSYSIETSRRWRNLPAPTRPEPKTCECCDGPPNGRGKGLHLDHDHETGKFRGWLCARCNLGIGSLGDDAPGVRKALDYLSRTT